MPFLPRPLDGAFVAIDFETADYGADSASRSGSFASRACASCTARRS